MAPISRPPPDVADAAQLGHLAQLDDGTGPLGAVLEPVERVHAAGDHPGLLAAGVEQVEGVVDAARLEQLERRNHVVHDGHGVAPPS